METTYLTGLDKLEIPNREPGYTYDLNKYACDILKKFNQKHNENFRCTVGIQKSALTYSSIDLNSKTIYLDIGVKAVPDETNTLRIEAMKLVVGYELARNIYANMYMSRLDYLRMTKDIKANRCRKIVMSCSMQVAADLHSKRFYIESGGELTDALLYEYRKLLLMGDTEDDTYIRAALKVGQMIPSKRVALMDWYNSFRADDYSIVDDIIGIIDDLSAKYLGNELGAYKYTRWIKAQLELDGFPNKINKIGKRR